MEFVLSWYLNENRPFEIRSLGRNLIHGLMVKNYPQARIHQDDQSVLVWLGDWVLPDGYQDEDQYFNRLLRKFDPLEVLKSGGHFYCLYYQKKKRALSLFTGFAGIMPVYYTMASSRVVVASSLDLLLQVADLERRISKRFVLEKLVFNYPLFQHTILENVWLLPAHHLLRLSGTLEIRRYFDVRSLFHPNPSGDREEVSGLNHFFQSRLNRYWPNDPWALSFTGGFDGRTLLACALHRHLNFICYAFGSSEAPDLTLPLEQSRLLQIPFYPIYLDDPGYLHKALQYGFEFIRQSAGSADMARAHYVYATRLLSDNVRFLMTGNFGSELFRAMHMTGEMIAYPSYLLFEGKKPEEILPLIRKYTAYQVLAEGSFRDAEEELMEDLSASSLLNDPDLSKNQRLYVFLLEEVFRKYFGPEITMQNHYLINRTPFLDFQFVQKLFSTRLAGVYNDFYSHNPVRRKKGQLWYAGIIRDMHQKLYGMKTGRGYAPKDLMHSIGVMRLMMSVMRKKWNGQDHDFYCVRSVFLNNLKSLSTIPIHEDIFSEPYLKDLIRKFPEVHFRTLLKTFSLNWYLQEIKQDETA
jgi:asparagine synthetase B (glutamine-hydrolysing)